MARRDGLPLAIGSGKPRELLAALLLHRNQPVTTEQLVEMLWPDARPDEPSKTIHVYVSRLRRALADAILRTEGAAYVLHVEPGQLDIDRFGTLVDAGRERLGAGDPCAAARLLADALALWRAEDALTDIRYAAFAQTDIAQLAEHRLEATELALEAELALGHHAAAVPRLKSLADAGVCDIVISPAPSTGGGGAGAQGGGAQGTSGGRSPSTGSGGTGS